MSPEFILGLIILLPLIILTLFRVKAALAFFALCVGSVLTTFVSPSMQDALRGYVAPNSQTVDAIVAVLLLWLPVLAVVFFKTKSIGSRQRPINAIPALCVGLVGVLLTVPLLTIGMQAAIVHTSVWEILKEYQAIIVLVGVMMSMFLVRLRPPIEDHHKGKHHR